MTGSVRESTIERYLCTQVQKAGGVSYKWASPSHRGVPDRLVLLNGCVRLVEVKAPGKKPTPLQQHTHTVIASQGFQVEVVDSKEAVDQLIEKWVH
jgi:hypothetical protein